MDSQYLRYGEDRGRVEPKGSWGEKQIARMFDGFGIGYFYEHPLAVVDRGKVRVWYPDFWLPNYGVAVEYFGVENSRAYSDCVDHKKEVYRDTGVECI